MINSFVTIMSGFLDIFTVPYDEYKKNTDIFTAVGCGMVSCMEKITRGSFDIVTRITVNLNSAIEWSQFVIYPEACPLSEISKFSQQPNNVIQGISDACISLIKELKTTGNIILLPFTTNLFDLPRAIPIIILKPIGATVYSVSRIMLGLQNNLITNNVEIKNKYKSPSFLTY